MEDILLRRMVGTCKKTQMDVEGNIFLQSDMK